MALFASTRQQQSSHLVEFRAGKMFTRGGGETGTPLMVHPDTRKGQVYITQSDDGLMHFCWKDRTTGVVEDDLILFPDDVEFLRVEECTTGRVFLLKFKNSPRKLFFWMQEPKSDKDEEHRRKVNELLNNPPVPGSGRGGRGGQDMDQFSMMNQLLGLSGSGSGGGEERMDLQNALAGMDQQQLMQLLNLMGGSGGSGPSFESAASAPRRANASSAPTHPPPAQPSASTAQPAATSSNGHQQGGTTKPADAIRVTDLQSILTNLGGAAGAEQQTGVDDVQSVAEILERESAEAGAKEDKKKETGGGSGPEKKKDKDDDEGMDLD